MDAANFSVVSWGVTAASMVGLRAASGNNGESGAAETGLAVYLSARLTMEDSSARRSDSFIGGGFVARSS